MSEYVITLKRLPGLGDAEVRRRLAAAYNTIIAASRKALARKTADDNRLAGKPSAASEARTILRATTGSVT